MIMKNKRIKLSKLAWIKAIAYAFLYLAVIMFVVGIKHQISRIISIIFIAISIISLIYSGFIDRKNLRKKIKERKLLYKEIKIAYYIILNKTLYIGMAFVILFTIYGFFFLTNEPLTSKDWIILKFILGIEILAIVVNYFLIGKTVIKRLKEEYLKELKSSKKKK